MSSRFVCDRGVQLTAQLVQVHGHVLPEGLRPSDSPTRSLARRCAGALRSRGSLARSLATWVITNELTFRLRSRCPIDGAARPDSRSCFTRGASPLGLP